MIDEPVYDDVPPPEEDRITGREESTTEGLSTACAHLPPIEAADEPACQVGNGASSSQGAAAALYSKMFQGQLRATRTGLQDSKLPLAAVGPTTGRPGAVGGCSVAQPPSGAVTAAAPAQFSAAIEKANGDKNTCDGSDEDGGVYVDLADCARWRLHAEPAGAAAAVEAIDGCFSDQLPREPTPDSHCAAKDRTSTPDDYFILENQNCQSGQAQPGGAIMPTTAGLVHVEEQTTHSSTSSIDDEPIYEPVAIEPDMLGSAGTVDLGFARAAYEDEEDVWTISEFETVSTASAANTMNRTKASASQGETILGRITGRLSFKSPKSAPTAAPEKFQVNRKKHPLPALPPMPDGLSEEQVKRRYVVESIINIENSYVNSLLRLQQHYVVPLKQNPNVISLDKTESIFAHLDDILKCHLMFQVALEESAKNWDADEKIGTQFVSSFSKSMVLESYTAYVNNFLTSTSLVKRLSRERQAFEAFLTERQRSSPDKVDVIGLMLKPVQRFPQYILQIKDLIKYTSRSHPDYLDLLHALTTLESIAYELNERKRASEEKLAAKVVLKKLDIKPAADDTYLVRQDDVERVEYTSDGQVLLKKPNRLLLFSDMLVCLRIDSDNKEKYYLKWYVPIGKVDYHDACRAPAPAGSTVDENSSMPSVGDSSSHVESEATANFDRLQQELADLRHDEELLHQIYELALALRQSYKGMTTEDVERHIACVMHEITTCHEQLKMYDSCTVQLSLSQPSTGGSSSRTVAKAKRVFQLLSPEVKQDWVLDFRAAKLAEGSQNKDGWRGNAEMLKYPLLIKNLPVDITRDGFQVFCATSVFLVSPSGGIGLQYLWLCGGKDGVGQVTIVCLHAKSPYVVESFKACNAPITAVCRLPGSYFAEDDQVWMASGCSILVYGSASGQHHYRTDATRMLSVSAPVVAMHCIGAYIYAALSDGSLLKCAVRTGNPLYSNPYVRRLSESLPVSCIVPADRFKLYCAIGKALYLISTTGNMKILETHELSGATSSIQCVIKIGLGLWVSFLKDPMLRMYHADTYEFLQDVNIDSAVHKLLPDVGKEQLAYVTTMTFIQGLLWIGTSSGHILTMPIPVVQGVPRIFGGMSISMNGHCSPVHFLLSVTCSLTSAPKLVSKSDLSPLPAEQQSKKADSGTAIAATEVMTRRWSADDVPSPAATSSSCEIQASQASPVSLKSKLPSRSASTKTSLGSTGAAQPLLTATKQPKVKRTNIFARRKPAAASPATGEAQAMAAAAAEGSPADECEDRNDWVSSEISRAAASDSGLCTMYSSLMKLDTLDNVKATADLVNRLVPLNVKPSATILTRAAPRRSLVSERVLAAAAAGGTRGSMADLRSSGSDSTNLLAVRRAHSSWALNADPLHSELKQRLFVRGRAADSQAFTDSLSEQTEEIIYDDVAIDDDSTIGGGSSSTRLAADRLLGSGRQHRRKGRSCGSLDELSFAEESDELLQSGDARVPADEMASTDTELSRYEGIDDDEDPEDPDEDPEERAVVETNVLKTALVISGGEGYINRVSNFVESQAEATILLWQHTQKSASALAL